MNDKKININLEIQPHTSSENKSPWYKKKSTIIALSSILGVSSLAIVIAVPIALTHSSTIVTPTNSLADTLKLLNSTENKTTRLKVWNQYMTSLSTPQTTTPPTTISEFDNIIRGDDFINQFIGFITNNLNIGNTTVSGSISEMDVIKMQEALSSIENFPHWKNILLAKYTNLFNFDSANIMMLSFENSVIPSDVTIDFTLSMPEANLDIFYNDDGTVSIKTMPNNTQIKLTINKFINLNIQNTIDVFFKSNVYFKLPSAITNGFINFLNGPTGIIKKEPTLRKILTSNFNDIKTNINGDNNHVKGLSYWNAFAINYAVSNNKFVANDLNKTIIDGGFYKFLKANATGLLVKDLEEFRSIAAIPSNIKLNPQPFMASPSYFDNKLFTIKGANTPTYSLALDISKFSYIFNIGNLFAPNPIIMTPILTFGGTLTRTTTDSTTTTYKINSAEYDVSALINMSNDPVATTGGLLGFFGELIKPSSSDPTKQPSDITKLTNGLVAINSKSTKDQMGFWNTFNDTNNSTIISELQKENVVYDLIMDNIDFSKTTNGFGTFPVTVDPKVLNDSINAVASKLTIANLKIGELGSIQLRNVAYDATLPANTFTSINVYFGNEDFSSISNFNVTSSLDESNISFSQTLGLIGNFDSLENVKIAAANRVSVVFEISTGSSNSAHVFYFGDNKKSIIISSAILTSATKFVETIKQVK